MHWHWDSRRFNLQHVINGTDLSGDIAYQFPTLWSKTRPLIHISSPRSLLILHLSIALLYPRRHTMRKVAVQVPDVVSRLLRAQVIAPPAWYQPSLSHPPLPLPPRQLSPSASTSQPRLFKSRNNQVKHLRTKKNRPREIVYEVDVIRRRFFEDYPFEALRPVSLVEGRTINEDVGVEGEAWTELAQRGEYPTVEK